MHVVRTFKLACLISVSECTSECTIISEHFLYPSFFGYFVNVLQSCSKITICHA